MKFEDLAQKAPQLRERINRFRSHLSSFFVGRAEVVDLMTVCAIAQEPLLLVGLPGTAKSEIVTTFRDALGVPESDYFEYMLTRFTEPSEILGPIDINQLKGGSYVRRVEGKLPTAKLAFLDEIFKSNSAILNSLLTLINERKYYQDGRPVKAPLKVLFAATNEIPDVEELAAIRDRFCFKVVTHSVQETHFLDLIDIGLKSQLRKEANNASGAEGVATFQDFLDAHDYLTQQMLQTRTKPNGKVETDRDLFFPESVLGQMQAMIQALGREDGVIVSDRKVVKLYKLLRVYAWLFHGGKVRSEDLRLLMYLGDTIEDLENLEVKIPRLLGAK